MHLWSTDLKTRLALSELVSSRLKANKWKYYVEAAKTIHVCVLQYVFLTDFVKTNLTKIAVIWVKRSQKAGFLSPRSSKIIVKKKEERRKRKSGEKERRTREKSNGYTLSFYNSYLEIAFGRKKLLAHFERFAEFCQSFKVCHFEVAKAIWHQYCSFCRNL